MIRVELREVETPEWYMKDRKIGKHTRKLDGQTFTSPRIILPPGFNDLIGRSYYLLEACAVVEMDNWSGRRRIEGKAVILLIPEKEEREEREEGEDENWEDDFDAEQM